MGKKVKQPVYLIKQYAMKTLGGGGTDSSILTPTLDPGKRASLSPVRFIAGERATVPTEVRLGGPQSHCRCYGVVANLLPLPIIEQRPFSSYPIGVATELPRLPLVDWIYINKRLNWERLR
jgi:hypothetical protein